MKKMSQAQAKLRRWFRRHGWLTSNTSTDEGFYIESPIHHKTGLVSKAVNPKTGKVQWYEDEARMGIELDRFLVNYVCIHIWERKVWLKGDWEHGLRHTYDPEDFGDWEEYNDGDWIDIPAEDIIKLADLIKAAQEDWLRGRKTKNHLNFMEGIAKKCDKDWIGRNSSYEEIKARYDRREEIDVAD